MVQHKTDEQFNWKNYRVFNQCNTIAVLFLYVLSWAAIGFNLDVIQGMVMENLNLKMAIKTLILLERPLYVTVTLTLLSILIMILFYLYHNPIFRLGLNARKLSLHTVSNAFENEILEEYRQIGKMIGLRSLPSLWVAERDIVNAFSSGYNERNSLVVLTRGLIERLDLMEMKAVLVVALYHIKLRDTQLTQAISLVSNGPLIFFDTLCYAQIYGKKKKDVPSFFGGYFNRVLINIRFMLPIMTCLYRFFLNPNRIYQAHILATNFLGERQSLISALIKIRDAHFDNQELISQAYSEISYDEVRREAYFFDPADFNVVQTAVSPFSTQPSIEEQLGRLLPASTLDAAVD